MADEYKGWHHITTDMTPSGYLKMLRYISKDEQFSDFAAEDIIKD